MTMRDDTQTNIKHRIDNISSEGYLLNTKSFWKSLRSLDPYVDLLEGKRTLKDMAKYGYDKTDFQAMRIFRYNLMKESLKINIKLDLFIFLMNLISFYLIIRFVGLNMNSLQELIMNSELFNIPIISDINFFIGFSILYFSLMLISFFKTKMARFTREEFFYKDNTFSTIGCIQLGCHTFLFMSYLFDKVFLYENINLQGFDLNHSIANVVVAFILVVGISIYLKDLNSLFNKIEITINKNGITSPSPTSEELIQKHKYQVYNDGYILNKNNNHKNITNLKSSEHNIIKPVTNNIVEITPEHIIRKRQQEIQEDLFESQSNKTVNKNTKDINLERNNTVKKQEDSKVIDINKNKVKRRARM